MLGAMIGDIAGSVYEWHNIKTKDFPLFQEKCFFTDDTVMTVAVAEALLNGAKPEDFVAAMRKYGRLYPDAGYGGQFRAWLKSGDPRPYKSWGNGSAMRVSPCGWFADSLEEAEALAERSAAVTHNHPEGIKGARATAAAIYLARLRKDKTEIKSYIESAYGYDLNRTLDEIRPSYKFNESCQKTVPEAIIAFLESDDFEDAIRNAISIGGDSDTLAAITGSIAEAAYGIPSAITTDAFFFLDDTLSVVINAWLNEGKPLGAQVKKSDWEIRDFSQPRSIHGSILFGEVQLARVRQGLLPEETEDKWFAYCEGTKLCFHRSWTGDKMYEAEIFKDGQNYHISEIKIERDSKRYLNTDDELDYRTFNYLFARGLLGLDVEVPAALDGEADALQAWDNFGRMIAS